jgi:glucose-6-phosphate 1-dehydrogenase
MKNFVILGASGNLARKKLFPALWDVYKRGYKWNYVGYGRTKFSNKKFRQLVKNSVNDTNVEFISKFSYVSGEYNSEDIQKISSSLKKGSTTYYLALPTKIKLIQKVVSGLKEVGLLSGNFRVVVEKPFGSDYQTAKQLMNYLEENIGKSHLFFIDHYLSKDLVRNLIALRFANPVFENIWSNKYIDKIEIQALEKIGIENRGEYYDKTGAIRDMIQNHLLQILSLTLMNRPAELKQRSVEKEKIKVLKNLQVFQNVYKSNIKIDQYKGYKKENYISKDSLTETYAWLKTEVDNERWQRVPIILTTGKKQSSKQTQITVYFKGFNKCPWNTNCPSITRNKLVLNIYPQNDIQLFINSCYLKDSDIKQIPLAFNFAENIDLSMPYANVLKDIYNNNKTYCPSGSEILLSWKFIDKVIDWIDGKREVLI